MKLTPKILEQFNDCFTLHNATSRKEGVKLYIHERTNCGLLDCIVINYDESGPTSARSEFIGAYDVASLVRQFGITHQRAKKLSDLIDFI